MMMLNTRDGWWMLWRYTVGVARTISARQEGRDIGRSGESWSREEVTTMSCQLQHGKHFTRPKCEDKPLYKLIYTVGFIKLPGLLKDLKLSNEPRFKLIYWN